MFTDFMGQFMAQDGDAGGHPAPGPGCEGHADGHPVRQVVDPVPEDHHPGHAGDGAGRRVDVTVGVAVAMVGNLEKKLKVSLCKS